MWIGAITLFPEMVAAVTATGVLGRAVREGIVTLEVFNPRTYTSDRHHTVDDRPYGGGPGMVMLLEPLSAAISAARARFRAVAGGSAAAAPVIYLSPRGARLDQQQVCDIAQLEGMILVAGRYEGVDERLLALAIDHEISIGDYVVSGGELPAMVLMDAVARQLPGTLGNSASAIAESHVDGLLDYPHYTRPEITPAQYLEQAPAAPDRAPAAPDRAPAASIREPAAFVKEPAAVDRAPAVLLSGDHRAIARWRLAQALLTTYERRPDLLAGRELSEAEQAALTGALAERQSAMAERGGNR